MGNMVPVLIDLTKNPAGLTKAASVTEINMSLLSSRRSFFCFQ